MIIVLRGDDDYDNDNGDSDGHNSFVAHRKIYEKVNSQQQQN